MKATAEEFQVSEVPAAVFEALVKRYRDRELVDLIKREPDLQPLARGFQLVTRNAKHFRRSVLSGMQKQERYAAPIYFDWLEDQEELVSVLKAARPKDAKDDESATFDKKTVTAWLKDGVDKESLWIYMHCSADRFPDACFELVEP